MIQEGGKRKVSRKSRSRKSMKGGAVAEVAPAQEGGKRKSKASKKSKKSKKSMRGGASEAVVAAPVQEGASSVQAGGRRRKSRKAKKSMKGGASEAVAAEQAGGKRRKSRKAKKSMKGGAAEQAQEGGKRKSKASKKSKKSRRSASKKSRREANPQITVRGALVKYVWGHLDVKKVAADKGLSPIGVPAKIVQMVMVEAMKDHHMTEDNKKNPAFWNGVQKTAMKLLADNLQKYAGMVKK